MFNPIDENVQPVEVIVKAVEVHEIVPELNIAIVEACDPTVNQLGNVSYMIPLDLKVVSGVTVIAKAAVCNPTVSGLETNE